MHVKALETSELFLCWSSCAAISKPLPHDTHCIESATRLPLGLCGVNGDLASRRPRWASEASMHQGGVEIRMIRDAHGACPV